MKVNEIREKYLTFFESKEHKRVRSAPMVVKDDPTLMFTNAGMNQFKDYFLGNEKSDYPRVAGPQKCLRVSGKHNDLEEVGVDTYHHTMFEMLGNWSFGDYFKAEAIEWCWELLTKEFKLDPDRLYVTVFEGDKKDGTKLDEDAIEEWKKWVDSSRILKADKEDNFWEMGDKGPCGPCSEIHYDARTEEERKKKEGGFLVNQDHPLVIEIWNLVFMEFNRKADGQLEFLPEKHVDTGLGLERLAMILQGKKSNYDTDLFQKLISKIASIADVTYGNEEKTDIALRVISDHIRAISFSITDGQLPSNTGAGYVIRRILRRAVRYGYQTLGLRKPFLFQLIPALKEEMGAAYKELEQHQDMIEKVIEEEEKSFFNTLEQGLKKINARIEQAKEEGSQSIQGQVAFELLDTYGFPYDLTALIAKENNLSIEAEDFDKALMEQQKRSKSDAQKTTSDWVELMEDDVQEFVGYDRTSVHIYITRYRTVQTKKQTIYQLVFNLTPFYPEGGGQVGDQGWLESDNEKIEIIDTKKENNLIVHYAKELPKNPQDKFLAVIHKDQRKRTAYNHTSTHLLHQLLREKLGAHVEQRGSLVHPDYLRFDFSHFSKVTDEELKAIEKGVNRLIRKDLNLQEFTDMPMEEAQKMGAMALFGEKYGDTVRIIKFGDSVELCGGTHAQSTAQIGQFKIITETSAASGIRRIEAITASAADEYIQNRMDEYEAIQALLKSQKSPLINDIKKLLKQNQESQSHIESLKAQLINFKKDELLSKIEKVNGHRFLGQVVDMEAAAAKSLLFDLHKSHPDLIAIIGVQDQQKAVLNIMIGEKIQNEQFNANVLVKDLAQKHIKGNGGGQSFLATAGGGKPEGLKDAIQELKSLVEQQ